MSLAGLVDWGTARTIADAIAGEDDPGPAAERLALPETGERAVTAVRLYTGLVPREPLPAGEWVSRREWARINLAGLEATMAAVPMPAERAGGRALGGLVAGAGAVLARLTGLQVGLLAGYAARNVLGQYEFALLGGARPARLLYVGANLEAAAARLELDRERLLEWVALHETTHALHFAAAPWLRDHVGRLARDLLGTGRLNPDLRSLAGRAGELLRGDPGELLGRLREGDAISLLLPDGLRPSLESIQATMSAIEGYAEHVMDAALPALGGDPSAMRERLERRRHERPPHARVLAWLLGLELKLRQYRQGKRFCDEVVAVAGVPALNRAWEDPRSLPVLAEIEDPQIWLERLAAPAPAL
jgi:coenzyme F420 biosynthesis associated uncharacterized protein